MSVLVVGVSHRTAPVALLERVTVGLHDTGAVVDQLRTGAVDEAVVLATCNRVEVYADTAGGRSGQAKDRDLAEAWALAAELAVRARQARREPRPVGPAGHDAHWRRPENAQDRP